MCSMDSMFGIGEGDSAPLNSQGANYLKMLNAYGQGMPELQSIEEQYQPGFTGIDLQTMQNELLGVNGQPGYLDIYSQDVAPTITGAQTAANTATRAANLADLNTMGPGAVAGVRALDPGQAALMDSLTKTATGELNLGTQLDPDTTANITNSVRQNWASRGLGASAPAQLSEAMQLYGGGQNLLNTREQEAGSVASLSDSLYTNPALGYLTGTSNAPAQAQGLTATGDSAGQAGQYVSPSSVYDMFNTVFNAKSAQTIADQNNRGAAEGALIGAGAQMGSSMSSM